MKPTIFITTVLALASIIAAYMTFGYIAAILIAVVCALFVWFSIHQEQHIQKQRKQWRAAAIPPDISEFDKFFWDLLIRQQNWYLENIYTIDDIQSLIDQYTKKVQEIWSDKNIQLLEKVDMAKVYIHHASSLVYYLDYIELKDYAKPNSR